jgi:hypothetical protein
MKGKNKTKHIHIAMNPGWARELLSQPPVEDMVRVKTFEVFGRARDIARNEAFDTGDYFNAFRVEFHRSNNGDRPVGHVVNDDYKWAYMEFGTRKNKAIHTLHRAVQGSNLGSGKFGGKGTSNPSSEPITFTNATMDRKTRRMLGE